MHFCMRAAEKSAVAPCGQPGMKTSSVSTAFGNAICYWKRNFLQSFGVKRQMDVFHQCRFPRLGRQGIENRASCGYGADPYPYEGGPYPQVPLRISLVRVVRVRVHKGKGKNGYRQLPKYPYPYGPLPLRTRSCDTVRPFRTRSIQPGTTPIRGASPCTPPPIGIQYAPFKLPGD